MLQIGDTPTHADPEMSWPLRALVGAIVLGNDVNDPPVRPPMVDRKRLEDEEVVLILSVIIQEL